MSKAEDYDEDDDIQVYKVSREHVHAIDISQKRVDETAKREHEWVEMQCPCGHKMYAKYTGREWVGLVTEEARKFYESDLSREELIHKIDEFLEEKNT